MGWLLVVGVTWLLIAAAIALLIARSIHVADIKAAERACAANFVVDPPAAEAGEAGTEPSAHDSETAHEGAATRGGEGRAFVPSARCSVTDDGVPPSRRAPWSRGAGRN